MTTGGDNGLGDNISTRTISTSDRQPMLPSDSDGLVGSFQGSSVDARLIPLADLQAQGGTQTATARILVLEGEDDPKVQEVSAPSASRTGTEALICAYPWPQGCDYWIGVAQCESTLGQDPNAYADWNPYVGLFQVDVAHGYGREWLEDDANNALATWELSHGGTYTGAWPVCQWQ